MNININFYLKFICPVLTSVFIAYFITTLFLFILPKRGIDFVNNHINKDGKINLSENDGKRNTLKKNRLLLKAIYKKYYDKSWVVVENKQTGKIMVLKEGDKVNETTLYKVNKHSVIFTTEQNKFTLKLDIKKNNIHTIINNGDN